MKLDSARNLKAEVFRRVFGYDEVASASLDEGAAPRFVHARALEAAAVGAQYSAPEMELSIGIAVSEGNDGNGTDTQLAVLLRSRKLLNSALVERIRREARGEVHIAFTGRIRPQAFPLDRERPIRIGCSVGHRRVTAGTVGCFVQTLSNGVGLLSNNHVLARSNLGQVGDAIIQPGKLDGGFDPADRIGNLIQTIPIQFGAVNSNSVDCAVSSVLPGIDYDRAGLPMGSPTRQLSGRIMDATLDMPVWKVGRTTNLTEGVVEIVELDQVMVDFGTGGNRQVARFDNQLAISGRGVGAFSKGGDSGAAIYETEGHLVALLFAGSAYGGANGRGLTFANPIDLVLDALDAELVV